MKKKWKKSLIAFQRQGCDKMFSSWIHFVLIFYEASEKNWKLKEIYHGFAFILFLIFQEASEELETVRNLALILFLTFHEASEKTGN